jgi:carbonic anhydrase
MVHTRHDLGSHLTGDQALERLRDGNARFMAGKAQFPTVQKDVLAMLSREQHPFATILGCSDSRVPPELLFDASFGELFVIRVAGNVMGPATEGSLQYAGMHLRTPLFVVLGHEGCGAVDAAMQEKFHGAEHGSRIELLLEEIKPALEAPDSRLSNKQQLAAAVEANVRHVLRQILHSPEGEGRRKEGFMKAVGAIFEFHTGEARFLTEEEK